MGSISKDVSISEMMTMRNEQNMTNQEIADALGCSYQTVLNLIGKQPQTMRKHKSYPEVRVPTPSKPKPEEEICPAALVLAERSYTLQGEIGRYEIDTCAQVVHIQIPEQGRFSVALKDIGILHNELGAILRNADKTRFGVEAW